MDEGEYDRAAQLVKEAANITIATNDDSRSDEEDDDDCVSLSDDDEEDDHCDDSNSDVDVKILTKKQLASENNHDNIMHDPFKRSRNISSSISQPSRRKWCEQKEIYRKKAVESALTFQAREIGLESVDAFHTVLDVVEINRYFCFIELI